MTRNSVTNIVRPISKEKKISRKNCAGILGNKQVEGEDNSGPDEVKSSESYLFSTVLELHGCVHMAMCTELQHGWVHLKFNKVDF